MNRKYFPGALAVLAALLSVTLGGCVNRIADFTVMSTKNIPFDFKVKGQGEGEDIQRVIVIIPTKGMPSMKEATDLAIEQRQGDALVNAKIYYRNFYIPYIYGEVGYNVKGDVVSTKENPPIPAKK